MADAWDLAEEEDGEEAGGGAEASEGHAESGGGLDGPACNVWLDLVPGWCQSCVWRCGSLPESVGLGESSSMDVGEWARCACSGGREKGGYGVLWTEWRDIGAVFWALSPWGNARSCSELWAHCVSKCFYLLYAVCSSFRRVNWPAATYFSHCEGVVGCSTLSEVRTALATFKAMRILGEAGARQIPITEAAYVRHQATLRLKQRTTRQTFQILRGPLMTRLQMV